MSDRLQRFYSLHFGQLAPNSTGECSVNCPFHEDLQASMSVNVSTGLWYCFRCDAADGLRGGDEYDFYKELKKREGITLRFNQVKAAVDALVGARTEEDQHAREHERAVQNEEVPRTEFVDISKIEQWCMMLDRTPRVKSYLLNDRGLNEGTLHRRRIGWDIERVTIPIPDREGQWINIRRYSASARGQQKMLSYRAGFGDAVLYPIENLEYEEILLCEGEMDCLLAEQLGYNAITVTGGAGTWKDTWNPLFTGKKVRICYDIDRAGRGGARKVANKIVEVAAEVKVIHLPISDPPDGDFTDYIVNLGHTRDDFDRLIEDTPVFSTISTEQSTSPDNELLVHLSQASNSEYDGKRIKVKVIVAGKDTSPYIIPKLVEISCHMDGRGCEVCGLGAHQGQRRFKIAADNPNIPQLLDCTNSQQHSIIRAIAGIPKACSMFHMEKQESQNVDQLLIIPELDFGTDEQKYVLRKAYHVYDDGTSLVTNRSYEMKGITVPDPRTQYSIHIINDVELSQDNISDFNMTNNKMHRLKKFQCSNGDIKGKFDEIHKDFVYNITHIYGRNDLLTAVDLTYHSTMLFDFMGKPVPKGMVECLLLGDTRTGKTETVQCMMNHYKLGEMITGENTSFAGLIGGMEQSGKRLILRWGKFPLNDRRLVILDEVSGMHHDIIGAMSGVRSSGVAEITKIGVQQKTSARVRAIWMSNPRSGRSLGEYDFGTDAVLELIGRSEDVARFDFIVTCASNEVDPAIINRIQDHGTVPHVYTFDLCKDLLMWAWSRKKDQVKFQPDAVQLILDYANEMGKTYTSKIPLVEAANQRIKLAKLAVSTAVRVFSTEDGQTVIVKPEHVNFAKNYLEEIYRKPSLGYYNQSMTIKMQQKQAMDSKVKVIQFLDRNPSACTFFLNNNNFNGKTMEDLLDLDRPTARRYLKFLNKCGMIQQTTSGYRKSPHFIDFLREWLDNSMNNMERIEEHESND